MNIRSTPYGASKRIKPFLRGLAKFHPLREVAAEGLTRDDLPGWQRTKYESRLNGVRGNEIGTFIASYKKESMEESRITGTETEKREGETVVGLLQGRGRKGMAISLGNVDVLGDSGRGLVIAISVPKAFNEWGLGDLKNVVTIRKIG